MKKIVIAGGGFAGVSSALSLLKNLPNHSAKITLIDQNQFHLFTPSLYEVATSEEAQKNIAIPYEEIFSDKIEIVTDKIKKINIQENSIDLERQESVLYDYLILAIGSEPAFYAISGLKDYSFPLKTARDAVKIKDKIHKLCDEKALKGKSVKIIIGGGGFAGTELAAEIMNYVLRLSNNHKMSRKLLEVFIIQGSDKLLKELDEHVSNIATKRLRKLGVDFIFGSHVRHVKEKELVTDKGEKFNFDILIWTGGVMANKLASDSGFSVGKSGQVIVNEYLQVKDFPNVFAVGDIAEFTDGDKKAPGVAQVAEEEGKTAGKNVVNLIENKSLKPYKLRHFGYLIPLKGRYAVFTSGMLHIKGFFGWVIQQIIVLRYFLGILSLPKAFKRWNEFEEDLRQE